VNARHSDKPHDLTENWIPRNSREMFIQFCIKNFDVFLFLLRYFYLSDIEQCSDISAIFISKFESKV